MTQARALALAAIAVVFAVFLSLLAVDVFHREQSLSTGDVQYDRNPGQRHLWQATSILPFGAARSALAVDDDLRYRYATRLFVLSQPRAPVTIGLAPARARAQAALEDALASESDTRQKSALMNMVGVVSVSNAASALVADPSAIQESISDFRRALQTDPVNVDAKSNLELMLRVLERQRRQRQQVHGSSRRRTGSRAGIGGTGSGY